MSARQVTLTANKTYKTRANAEKAVADSRYGQHAAYDHLTWTVMQGEDGRFFPVFFGERAIQAMVHFQFTVAG